MNTWRFIAAAFLAWAFVVGVAASALADGNAPAAAAAGDKPALPDANYVPQFSWAKTGLNHYWILDHGQRVALFGPSGKSDYNYGLALIRQFPGQAPGDAETAEPEVVSFVSRQGLGLFTNWISNKTMRGVVPTLRFEESDGRHLIARLLWVKNASEKGTQDLTFYYDAALKRYAVSVTFDLLVNERGGGEFCNFYPHGAGDFRPDVNKYNRLAWTDPNGKPWSHWLGIGVSQPGPMHLADGGTLAYFDEASGNPAIVLEQSVPPARVEVCCCWFDSHLIWNEPTDPKNRKRYLDELSGPPYHYYARLKAYWLNAGESRDLLAAAEPFSLTPYADRWNNLLPISMGKVNDLERRTEAGKPPHKEIYLQMRPGSITWDSSTPRSGAHSLLFELPKQGELRMTTTGPELMVTPGKRVKIGAWVKAEGVEGEGFYLESSFARFDPDTGVSGVLLPEGYQSPKVTGATDWTYIEIPMPVTPKDAQFLGKRITFVLKGKGKVYLDDLEFSEK